jgi:nucleoside-diphosphate-sugar epimerase
MFQGKEILITGSNGVFGYALCRYLLGLYKQGHRFNAVCWSKRQYPGWFKEIFDCPAFHFSSVDLSDPDYVKSSSDWADYIFHFACYGRPQAFMADPLSTINLNVGCTEALLNIAQACGGQLFFASTSEVYGDPDVFPTPETFPGNSQITHDRACYIESKRLGEVLCLEYNRRHDMNNKIGRIALAFGPGVEYSDQRVVSTFIRQALENKKVTPRDKGLAERCYLYIDDAIQMILNTLQGKESVYNVGGKEEVTVARLAQLVAEYCNVPCEFPTTPESYLKAPGKVLLDTSRYENEFGALNLASFDSALSQTVKWFKDVHA